MAKPARSDVVSVDGAVDGVLSVRVGLEVMRE